MFTKKMEEALNKQINAEFYSAYLYLSMSAYFRHQNLNGFAHWMRIQTMEESTHALKLYDFVLERGGKVHLTKVDGIDAKWNNIIDVFEQVLAHEIMITKNINNLVDIGMKEKDNATLNMLQWFIKEQVEDEANAEEILQQLKLIKGEGQGVLLIDRELKGRVFVDSTKQQNAN
jgi:ferritin